MVNKMNQDEISRSSVGKGIWSPDRLSWQMHSQQTRRAMRPGYIPVAGFRAQTFLQFSAHDAYLILLKATHAADAEKAPAFRCGDGFPLQGAGFPFAFHLHAAKLLHTFRFVESMELCLPTGSSVATSSPKNSLQAVAKMPFIHRRHR